MQTSSICAGMQTEMSERVFTKICYNNSHLWDVGFQVIFNNVLQVSMVHFI